METTKASDYKKRVRPTLTLPSGAIFQVRKPGPEIAIRAGRLPRNLLSTVLGARKGESEEETGMRLLEEMSDEEFGALMLFARDMVQSIVVSPRIVVGATREDELDPADLDSADFWALFGWGVRGGETVQMGESEVSVGALETFRQDGGVLQSGTDSSDLRAEGESDAPN